MSERPVLLTQDALGVATLTFNRPEVNNAYNDALLQGIHDGLDRLQAATGLRALVLRGNGRHFQAGADLQWVNALLAASDEAIREASRATAAAVDRLNRLPVPVVALIQGACFGGGTGFAAAADVVIAADNAIFAIAEVRWGLHAGIIIPQLNDAISVRQVRRYALTGERFGAEEARRIGLVHEVVPLAQLEARGAEIVAAILANSPTAIAATKAHILEHAWGGFAPATLDALVESHARARRSPDAAEGVRSFAEKRAARWAPAKT